MTKIKPVNWPSNLDYINNMNYSKTKIPKKNIIGDVYIKTLDETHILNGQKGLFAKNKLEKFKIIGEYTGEIIKDEGGEYCAFLTDEYCIDAKFGGNELRFINDYRNISEKPNTRLEIVYLDKKPKVLVIVIEDINEGDEILLSYGDNYWK